MLEWKIYYENLDTYSNEDGPWEDAPGFGLIAVLTLDTTGVVGRFMVFGHDLYYRIPGHEVMGSSSVELIRTHIPTIRDNQIKRGGNAFLERFQEILSIAGHDPGFPRSTPARRFDDVDARVVTDR